MNTETVEEKSAVPERVFAFTHFEDPEKKMDLGKANRACRHCYGTGLAGRMHLTGVRLVCKCVVKATYETEQAMKKK